MDYCLRFDKSIKSEWINEVAELKIRYNNALNVYDFLTQHPTQRVIIYFKGDELLQEIEQKAIIALKTERHMDNFALCLDEALIYNKFLTENKKTWLGILEKLKNAAIPFFFSNLVRDFETLQYFISAGVSDVVVAENMGFKLDKVAKICKRKGVKVRAIPNICQTPLPQGNIYGFFIRPEDIPTYEQYIDVCEFSFQEGQQDTYYKIYAKDKKWFGNLQEIIIGLDTVLDSRFIIKQFAKVRSHCGKKCFEGNGCQVCDRCLALAETLQDNNIIVDHY